MSAPLVFLLLTSAELFLVFAARVNFTDRSIRAIDPLDPGGCLHEGRWHAEGAPVRTRSACLRCACSRGVLACARRACAPLPDPPPHRCHILMRKGACCPELHCPDGVKLMELGASARFEEEEYSDTAVASVGHACVEGGTVYGAGSALASSVACEQCFCLGGARRCVRPRCLPPPPGCVARPSPGACCPQRYYCSHPTPPPHGTHDCKVDGTWYTEGERVATAEQRAECTQCFCLRGAVRCQPFACAPPLLGCKPRLRPGECCPHQYHCEHNDKFNHPLSHNSLMSVRNDDRSLHTSKSSKIETSTKSVSTSIISTNTNSPATTAPKKASVSTSKVKRKTDELTSSTSQEPVQNLTSTTVEILPSTIDSSTTEKLVRSNFGTHTGDYLPESDDLLDLENITEATPTEQPESSVRIVINGTINCTAELSSTSLPLNLTTNDTERIKMEVQPRIPIITTADIESHTFNPNDIITDRNVNGDFDDTEMFTINVTSSLSTNASRATPGPAMSTVSKITVPTDPPSVLNVSKKTNEFDFDYAEPTLPPSLPNLKIIPFVAADAVVDDEPPKDVLAYHVLKREDKFPVYYPTLEAKDSPSLHTSFASRREDMYHPTQYPVFTSEKAETPQYPEISHEGDIDSSDYPTANNNFLREHSVSTSLGAHASEANKAVTKTPSTSTTFRLESPSVNLFSPPVETEGGFIPKGPGIIDEYYAVYPSTPAPSVPHLTTSMRLDTTKVGFIPKGPGIIDEYYAVYPSTSAPSVPHLTTSMELDTTKVGFIPKGPGIIDEYYAAYPSTPASSVSHLTTSMELDTAKDCITPEGHRVDKGATVYLECSVCSCARGKLHCAPRSCLAPDGCYYHLTSSNPTIDTCCGELICVEDNENETTSTSTTTTEKIFVKINESIYQSANKSVEKNTPQTVTNETKIANKLDNKNTTKDIGTTIASVKAKLSENNHSADITSTTGVTISSTEAVSTSQSTTTTAPILKHEENKNQTHSTPPDYDEEDEGFSFGSVLKLLLSDSFDATTASPYKKKAVVTTTTPAHTKAATTKATTTLAPSTSRRPVPKSTVAPFVPMPNYPYVPPKKTVQQNTVNRIDHLVLGEATAIKKPTPRPTMSPYKPVTMKRPSHRPLFTTLRTTTRIPTVQTSVPPEGPRQPANGLPGVGGLKLAGCNIYGRMYRVGRIIAELSTPCQECRCTELGVQCRSLTC